MAGERYDQVIRLVIDGEPRDKEYRGLVSKWKNYRYAAYKALVTPQGTN